MNYLLTHHFNSSLSCPVKIYSDPFHCIIINTKFYEFRYYFIKNQDFF